MSLLKIGQLVQFKSTLLSHVATGTIYKLNINTCAIEFDTFNPIDKDRIHVLNNKIIISNKDIMI
ncbi:hypothetical protein [Vagococcus xieshaowenii]|uniref:DUF2187 domain-containing protein n=1 Tax=Vagococcus xieshaowenii TaxID=2562451 RepID=A0AAJ5EGM9_9ENTE|nr:hypothetical protein [Vagococcus xieshaowenii]QCA29533.1 hypothetical protein E4Z98_09445 [Vagococcus xieshaowenii]TFZ42649.1 hypothetical protein E4031_02845 [Vagococcus xieshaowenii]